MPFDPSSAVLDEPKSSTGFDPSGGVELVEEQPQAVQPTVPIPEPMPFWEAQRKASAELAALSPEARQEMQTPLVTLPENAFVPSWVGLAKQFGVPGAETAEKVARGVSKPLKGMVEAATSPVGLATLPAFVGAPELMGPMTSVQAAPGIKEGYETAKQGIKEGDIEKTVGGISEAVANTVFTALGPAGLAAGPRAFGLREQSTPPKPPVIPPVVEVGTHEKLMPRATETFEATTGTKAAGSPSPSELPHAGSGAVFGSVPFETSRIENIPTAQASSLSFEPSVSPAVQIGKLVSENKSVQGGRWTPENLRNFSDSLSLAKEEFESGNVEGGRMVQSSVIDALKDPQIFNSVISSIPVDVVNKLGLGKLSSEQLLHNQPMFIENLRANPDLLVTFKVGDAVVDTLHKLTKEYYASKNIPSSEIHAVLLRDAQEGKGTEALPVNEGQPRVRTEATPIETPIRENGGMTSIVLPDGTAVVGGRIHAQTYDKALELGVATNEQLEGGIAGFTRPDGTSWDLQGNTIKASRVINLAEVQRQSDIPTSEASAGLKALAVGEREIAGPTTRSSPPPAKSEEGARKTATSQFPTETKPPLQAAGREKLVTLYRAESPTVKFGDVFSAEKLGKFAQSDKPGQFWTTDPNYADYFRESYGKDAVIQTTQVPKSALEQYRVSPVEFKIPEEITKPASPSTRQAPESPAPAAEAVRGPSTSGVAASEVPPVIRESTTEGAKTQLPVSEQAKLFTPEALATPREETTGITPPGGGIKQTDVKAVKNFFQKHFTVAGHLPREIWEGPKLAMEGEISSLQTGLKYLERDFMNALGEVYGLNRVQIAGGGAKRIPVQAVQLMDEYLKGRVANVSAIPAPIRGVLDTMRAEIDGWSKNVMAQLQAQANRLPLGSAEAKALQQRIDTIRNNLDIYVHRSYKFFDSKASAPDWYENLNAGIRTRAEDYLINNATTPITRSQAQSLLLNWLNDLKEGGGFGSGKLGSKDLSIFLKRKSIAPEIREVLGEYHNPLVNYAKSVSKMGEWVAKQRFLEETKRVGMGRWLFEEDAAPPGYNTRISGEGSETMSPLNGLRTTKEIADAFKEFDKASDYGWIARTYLTVNAWSKIAATALSVMTQARNLLSRPFMAGMAGHWQYGNLGKSIKAIAQDFAGTDKTWQAYIQKLQKLNVLGDTSRSGELRAILKDASLQDVAPGDLYSFSTWRAIKKYGYEIPKEFYRMSDELGNIFGFESERALQAKIHPTWTPEQLDAAAAKVVRDLYPTYSETPGAVKAFRKVPLTGPFVTFPYQVLRTTWNSFARSFHEIRSSNPMERAVGYKRLSSQMATIAATWAVQEAAKNALGVTTQQETDFRRFQPPWSRNSKWAFTAKDEKTGSLSAINLSYMDPYSYISDPMVALASAIRDDKDLFEIFVQVGTEALRPWVSEQMLTKALIEARNGKTDTGREIYNATDSSYDKFTKQVGHVVKALEPGTVQRFQKRILPAARNEQPVYGRKLELGPEIAREVFGLAVEKFDFKTGLAYRAKDFIEKDRASESVFHQTLSRTETTTPENLLEAYKESDSRRQLIWKEMRKDFLAAVRNGVTENDARKTMEARGMTKEDARNIAQGRYKPLEIGDQARKRAKERGREIPRQAIRDYQQTARNISLDD